MKALILLSSLGVISLCAEIFSFKKLLRPVVLLGLLTTLIINVLDWGTDFTYFNMMRYGDYAIAFTTVILVTAILWFLISGSYFLEESSRTDHFALVLFALVGAVIMVSYTNMTMLFLGIEILSIPTYILAGSKKEDVASNESAFKYLIMGAFATGFLLFGIVLIYGATGSFDLTQIHDVITSAGSASSIFYTGILLMLIGLAFKVSAAPFHFWTPDVYQGAPTEVTAFMATIVKTAAFAAFLRLFSICFSEFTGTWGPIVWVMAVLTLLIGNVTAVLQTSTKRMLAYSSVAHAGYMLLALLAGNEHSNSGILYYAAAYSIGSIASFGVVNIVSMAKGGDGIDSFNGLGKSNPLVAFVMSVSLLSLAGIPPAAGFFAKYYIFTAAFKAGHASLVLIAILASLVGVYYYFRIIIAMYFKESAGAEVSVKESYKILLIFIALVTVALGLFPDHIIKLL